MNTRSALASVEDGATGARAKTVLNAVLDRFYASVEQRDNTKLAARPVAVGTEVVLAASIEAQRLGVTKSMSIAAVRQQYPDVVTIAPRIDAYTEASEAAFAIYRQFTHDVEALAPGEAFLNMPCGNQTSDTPTTASTRLRRTVVDEVGLALTVGSARTRFLAKVAANQAGPGRIRHIPAADELAVLHRLPVDRLWGVGPITSQKLAEIGIHFVGELATIHEATLVHHLGPVAGRHLHRLAWDRDPSRATHPRAVRSIGAQRALANRPRSAAEIHRVVSGLADRVGYRLQDADRCGRTITIELRFDDTSRTAKSRTLPAATNTTATIREVATELADSVLQQRAASAPTAAVQLTRVGLSTSNLAGGAEEQLSLGFSSPTVRGLKPAF